MAASNANYKMAAQAITNCGLTPTEVVREYGVTYEDCQRGFAAGELDWLQGHARGLTRVQRGADEHDAREDAGDRRDAAPGPPLPSSPVEDRHAATQRSMRPRRIGISTNR